MSGKSEKVKVSAKQKKDTSGNHERVRQLAQIVKDFNLKSLEVAWDGAVKIVAEPEKSSNQYQEKALELLNQKTNSVTDEDILFNPFAGLEEK